MTGLIIDSFAGGGGASLGIRMALGRSPDIAINHNSVALAIHAANHPETRHLSKNIWHVDPIEAVGRRPVDLAWFSPDCRHFSKAKGGMPVARNIRDLAWTVVLWAQRVRPAVICLENVEEFRTWGPVGLDNRPIKDRAGETFKAWMRELRRLGYRIEWRELRACDYGAPTIRKRFFLVARCDGLPIIWPEPTHGDPTSDAVRAGRLLPWRTAADVIDWSIPCPSIFLSREEGRALGVHRPLAPATMARIAKGVWRYVIQAEHPFVVGDMAPHITKFRTGAVGAAVTGPMPTVTANSAVHGHVGGAPPLGVVAAFLAQHNTDRTGYNAGRGAAEPLSTVTSTGAQQGVVAAFLSQAQQGGRNHSADLPHATITASRKDQNQVIAAHMLNLKGSDRRDRSCDDPVSTICGGGRHVAEVSAFLTKYYGTGGESSITTPMHTVTGKARMGLITVEIGGEPYVITDIGMRMLTPRELFRAQGFPDSYIIDRGLFTAVDGRQEWRPVSKTAQISACGNSVCPQIAAALVRAQFPAASSESEAA
jgi:DNA (cytosine-5)-methyltransferase 1